MMRTHEIQRYGLSPKQFFSYCRRELFKKGFTSFLDYGDFESWANPTSIEENHSRTDDGLYQIYRTKPFYFQAYVEGQYNLTLEFDFDDDKTGFGYCYIAE